MAGLQRKTDMRPALLGALAYSDLFDYPLTLEDLERYQVGSALAPDEIRNSLGTDPLLATTVSRVGEYYCLRGREGIVDERLARKKNADRLWPRALRYARLVAGLPCVRMVAFTGSLAVDNINTRADIDLLVVAEPGRVWICRRQLVAVVRLARALGDELCPNFVLSAGRLTLDQQDLFTARELAQMIPFSGLSLYRQMLLANNWARDYLPRGFAARPVVTQSEAPVRRSLALLSGGAGRMLRQPWLDGWERWEMERLRGKLRPLLGASAEVVCSPDQCKGHTGLHRASTITRYRGKLAELNLLDDLAYLLDGAPALAEIAAVA